jgi:flavin-dependent dehydrogenase
LETVPGGWLFFIPTGKQTGIIQAVTAFHGDESELLVRELIGRSTYVKQAVADITGTVACHPAMPAFCLPSGSHGWLAVGEAALAQDPLSGDGVGTSIRSAVLAAAVLAAVAAGEDDQRYLEYYSCRLARAARVHLEILLDYYSLSGDPAWSEEISAMRTGVDVLRRIPPPQGFRLDAERLPEHPRCMLL